jgi:protein MpaA
MKSSSSKPYIKSSIFGFSSQGLPIESYDFGNVGPRVLILGGVHGNEVEGTTAALGLLREFSQSFTYNLQLTLVPKFNIDGVLARSRVNGRGVDLNRNLPSNDWNPSAFNERYPPGPFANSEPENQALTEYLAANKPQFIISLHSWEPMLNVNGDCMDEAQVIHKMTGYRIDEHIGYPTPGCLGTYAGLERGMPTLTYEIRRGSTTTEVLQTHIPAILEALKVTEKRKI